MPPSPSQPPPPGTGPSSDRDDRLRIVQLLRPLRTERVDVTDEFSRRVLDAIVRHGRHRSADDPSLSGLMGRAARSALNLLTHALTPPSGPLEGTRPVPPAHEEDPET